MQHLDDGTINELLDGEIASSELPPITRHLAECSECRVRLEQARELIAESDNLVLRLDDEAPTVPEPMPAPVKRLAAWPRNLAWAASLIVAVGVGYISGHAPKSDAGKGVTAVSTEPGAVASTPGAANELRQPAAPAEKDRTRAGSSESTGTDTRQTEPGISREQSAVPAPAAKASGASKPVAAPPSTAPGDEVASRPATADVASNKDGVLPDAKLASRDGPPFDSVEMGSINGISQANLAPPHRRLFRSTKPSSTDDSLGTPAGTLFRIDGLNLLRSEVLPDQVRLIYSHPNGEVTLVQHRVGSEMAWHLVVPVGFPADTLSALLGRVR